MILGDPAVEIILVAPVGKPFDRSKLHVQTSSKFNRKLMQSLHEADINEVWRARTKKNPKLWNGSKFRIESASFGSDDNSAKFNIGLTSYKDFIGTNWSLHANLYQQLGEEHFGNSQAHMSDALGVGALVRTADDCMILLRRSKDCAEAVGLLDIPGGHPEPKALIGNADIDDIIVDDLNEQDIIEEIFNATLKEISEEVNIPLTDLSNPLLLGIARNTTNAGKPSSEYFVRCTLTSDQVEQRYRQQVHLEADESTDIVFLPISDVTRLQENKLIWNDLAPSAKGCVILFQRVMIQKTLDG